MFPRDSRSKGRFAGLSGPGSGFPKSITNKGGPMSVDQKTVRHIARLARIAVRDDELEALAKELNGILDWVSSSARSIPPMWSP